MIEEIDRQRKRADEAEAEVERLQARIDAHVAEWDKLTIEHEAEVTKLKAHCQDLHDRLSEGVRIGEMMAETMQAAADRLALYSRAIIDIDMALPNIVKAKAVIVKFQDDLHKLGEVDRN